MKRITLIIILSLIFGINAMALPIIPGYDNGIVGGETPDSRGNKYFYREVLFLSGEPVVVEGSVTITERGANTGYVFSATSKDGTSTLSRNLTITTEDLGNGTFRSTIPRSGLRESITINGISYTLTSYTFYTSVVKDIHTSILYNAGAFGGTKTYRINGANGNGDTITVVSEGRMFNNINAWGYTETHLIDQTITRNIGGVETIALARVSRSFNKTKEVNYLRNEPLVSSISGTYHQYSLRENVLTYNYSYTDTDGEVIDRRSESSYRFVIDAEILPLRLSRYRDIKGHPAEDIINILYGLDILGTDNRESEYFGPDNYISRADFAKAIAKALDLMPKPVEDTGRNNRNQVVVAPEDPLFKDVPMTHPHYAYIQEVAKRGIINGVREGVFAPNQAITRVEAVVILVRSLGLEQSLVPNPPFIIGFEDDNLIGGWAREQIYLSRLIGLVTGVEIGGRHYFRPGEVLTKTGAAYLLYRFIEYLLNDIKEEYRERIINYY